jgi:hypothetical protein
LFAATIGDPRPISCDIYCAVVNGSGVSRSFHFYDSLATKGYSHTGYEKAFIDARKQSSQKACRPNPPYRRLISFLQPHRLHQKTRLVIPNNQRAKLRRQLYMIRPANLFTTDQLSRRCAFNRISLFGNPKRHALRLRENPGP